MQHRIIHPTQALQPYIYRYVFVRADGSTDTMTPPAGDPRFVNGKHVQPLLPNYGSLIFMRNVVADLGGTRCEGLTLLGANQRMIGLTTLGGWFEGMLLDFEPGGMHALLGIDMQQLAGRVLTAVAYGDAGLQELDRLFKSTPEPEQIASLKLNRSPLQIRRLNPHPWSSQKSRWYQDRPFVLIAVWCFLLVILLLA